MNKLLITTVFAVFLFSKSSAQQNTKNNFEFGLGGGYNVSIATNPGGYLNNPQYYHGFNLGVSGEYYFSNSIGLRLNLIYDQKGYVSPATTYTEPSVFYTGVNGPFISQVTNIPITDNKITYLTVPLVLNIYLDKKGHWYVNAGFYVGFLLSNSNTGNTYNKGDGGAAVGAGFKFPLSKETKLFIEYNGQYGLTNAIKGVSSPVGSYENERTAFNIGLNFK